MRDEIFAYEFDLEEAWAQHLERCGLTVNLDFTDSRKKAPFIDNITYLAEPTGTKIRHAGQEYSWVFRGTLSTRMAVARNAESRAKLKLMVGRVRIEGQRFNESLNEGGLLPDYWINDMVETVPARGHFEDRKHDWIELRHTVTLNIRPSAFTS